MNRPIAPAPLTGDPGTPATNPKTGEPIWTAAQFQIRLWIVNRRGITAVPRGYVFNGRIFAPKRKQEKAA